MDLLVSWRSSGFHSPLLSPQAYPNPLRIWMVRLWFSELDHNGAFTEVKNAHLCDLTLPGLLLLRYFSGQQGSEKLANFPSIFAFLDLGFSRSVVKLGEAKFGNCSPQEKPWFSLFTVFSFFLSSSALSLPQGS